MPEIIERLQAKISDRYHVERELGQGGMATVYLATDVRHERQVAIKVLHPDLSATIGADRFNREIKLAAKLQHPHILGLIDSGEADGLLFYVMPFIQGESVRDLLDRDKQLSVDDAIQITLEVADALGYAHAQGIIHRDIKPENVMMSNGHALVADFGIARARTEAGQSRLTQTGMAVGTPVYMSPEQATGETVGPSADLYSLGCMLYEMLAGEPPFSGSSAMAIMAKHAMEAVPSVRIVRPSVPEEVEEAILAAMEKSPADRPKTAAEFCDILGTPLGATAARRITSRHTAYRRVPTAARQAYQAAVPLWRRPKVMVPAAVGVVGLIAAGTLIALNGNSGGPSVGVTYDAKKVAVLYFDDLTPDSSLGYLAEGLTETLIDQLKPVTALEVLSKDAVGRFRGRDVSTDSIARVLEAGTLVKGSVSDNGNRVRISISLIDGNTGAEKAKGIELPDSNMLAVRQIVVDSVGAYLREHLGSEVRTRELAAGTTSPLAWALVQRAEKRRKDAVRAAAAGDSTAAVLAFAQADSLLAQAETEDPKWVNPIALRSAVADNKARATPVVQRAPWINQGLAHAQRALKLDSTNLDARETRGRLRHLLWSQQTVDERQGDVLLEGAREDLLYVTRQDRTRALAWIALSSVHSQLKDPTASYLAAVRAQEEDAYFSGVENVVRQLSRRRTTRSSSRRP